MFSREVVLALVVHTVHTGTFFFSDQCSVGVERELFCPPKSQNEAATDGKREMCPILQPTEALNWPKLICEVVSADGKGRWEVK